MALKTIFVCASLFFCLESGSEISAKPKITIGVCKDFVRGGTLAICCRTEHLADTGVTVEYKDGNRTSTFSNIICENRTQFDTSRVDILDILENEYGNLTPLYNITCHSQEDVKVYAIRMIAPQYRNCVNGDWVCSSYAGSDRFAISEESAVDTYTGSVDASNGLNAELKWTFLDGYQNLKTATVKTSSGVTLLLWLNNEKNISLSDRVKFIGIIERGQIWLRLSNVTHYDAGTYVCEITTRLARLPTARDSLILVVHDYPTKPLLIPRDVITESAITSGTIFCAASSQTSGYLEYMPTVNYTWKYPDTGAGYIVNNPTYDSIVVTEVNCSMKSLPPIGCAAYEGSGTSGTSLTTETVWMNPLQLCSMDNRHVNQCTTNNAAKETSSTAAAVIVVVLSLMFVPFMMLYIIIYRRRRGLPFCCCTCRNPFSSTLLWWRRRRTNEPANEIDNNGGHYVGEFEGPPAYDGINRVGERQPAYNGMNRVGEFEGPPAYAGIHLESGGASASGRARAGVAGDLYANRVALPPLGPGLHSLDANEVTSQFYIEARNELNGLSASLKHPPLTVWVRRNHIVEDVMHSYENMDSSNVESTLTSKFAGEEGVDAGGVMKDMFTSFWHKAKESYFKGNVACVPVINMRCYDMSPFVTLGRIFAHSTAILKTIPIQICRSTLNMIIFGDMEMTDGTVDIIIEDFLLFVDNDDRTVLRQALDNFDALSEDQTTKLRYIFANFEMENIPRKETLKKDIASIAHNELCAKPKSVCEQMRKGIPMLHQQMFWAQMTIRHIDGLYEDFRPTARKVISKLRCTPWPLGHGSKEIQVFDHLKRFLLYISRDLLLEFLQFVTAERKIPAENITVTFTDLTGLARRPVAHTCVCRLELPKSYTQYEDLKREFTSILTSADGMCMNMQ